jgi:hypothetical protein
MPLQKLDDIHFGKQKDHFSARQELLRISKIKIFLKQFKKE